MKVKILNQQGQETNAEVELPGIFSHEKGKPELVHFVANAMLSNQRNTTASTKTRGEVRGGGKKPWAQKGTGRARHGSIRSPLWKGGGITFGPRPNRNFVKKVNKKVRRLALLTGLTDKAQENHVFVVDSLIATGKTKEFQNLVNTIAANSRKNLVVVPSRNEKARQAARNLPKVRISLASNLNLLDILWADSLIVLKEALPIMEKTYGTAR